MSSGTLLPAKHTVELFRNELGTFTDTTWEPDDDLGFEDWSLAIQMFDRGRKAFNFWIGDGLNWGEMKWGESYAQVAETLNVALQTLYNWKWVCSRVPPSVRKETLEWEHHKLVASKTVEEQATWLGKAEMAGWTTRELTRAMQGEEVTLIGSLETLSRGKRKLLTEFFNLAVAEQETIDKWLETLSRAEVNRLLDGELDEALVRLRAILDILRLY